MLRNLIDSFLALVLLEFDFFNIMSHPFLTLQLTLEGSLGIGFVSNMGNDACRVTMCTCVAAVREGGRRLLVCEFSYYGQRMHSSSFHLSTHIYRCPFKENKKIKF